MNGKILANLGFFVTLQMPSDEFIALFKKEYNVSKVYVFM